MNDSHPTLLNVNSAREEGVNGDYEACLKFYSLAKQEAENEINISRNLAEKTRWNTLVKDIVAEEAAIRRIKNAIEEITHLMNVDDAHYQGQASSSEDVEKPAPINNDLQVFPIRRQLKPGEKRTIQKKQSRFSAPPKRPSNSSPKNPSQINDDNKKIGSKIINSIDNPLVKQIIDMGILIKEPNVLWESIAGLNQVKRLLRQNLVILPMRPDICKGLLSPWRSVLFYGPPGTGKTFLAKAVATECQRTFFNITSATITSRFLGESEKLISVLFSIAEEMAPSTIFFDEIDSIASQRGSKDENEASRRMKAQLLTKIEGIDGLKDKSSVFILAATNFPWDLDEALLRRFQKRIYIPLPDCEGRESLLRMHIGEMADETFNYDQWVIKLDGYSCSDIANLCRDTAQYVFDKQTKDLDTKQWLNLPIEQARVIINNQDFAVALSKRKSSVDPALIEKYEQWKLQKGAE